MFRRAFLALVGLIEAISLLVLNQLRSDAVPRTGQFGVRMAF